MTTAQDAQAPAIEAQMLIHRPVAEYIPEYARNGKEGITIG
jgi:hypothetical protein